MQKTYGSGSPSGAQGYEHESLHKNKKIKSMQKTYGSGSPFRAQELLPPLNPQNGDFSCNMIVSSTMKNQMHAEDLR